MGLRRGAARPPAGGEISGERHAPVAAWLLACIAGAGLCASLSSGCEPQDIYLFDAPPTRTSYDAGAVPDEPDTEPSEPSQPNEPDPPPPPPPEQPACESAACEACVAQGSCEVGSTLLFCHPRSGACVLPCDASAPPQATGNCPMGDHCEPAGVCVDCVVAADCAGDPLRAACDPVSNTCVECFAGSDTCPAGLSACDPVAQRCVECIDDTACQSTYQVCQVETQRCVQCVNDADCRGSDDDVVCLQGQQRCVECVVDADCRSEPDKPFCSSEFECEDERE